MKELSVEEKAKRYDEILARATGANLPYYTEDIMSKVKEFVDYLIPELKESEDEIIKKAIKYGLDYVFTNNTTVYETTKEQCLAWLEKQGEYANFRNKIQIGDKVTRNRDGMLVNLSQLNRVAKKDENQEYQKPAEWSEEDEKLLNDAISLAHECDDLELGDWLKSLKYRCTWKPSEEQMVAIQEAINIVGILTITGSKINSLYQDLKKLKG